MGVRQSHMSKVWEFRQYTVMRARSHEFCLTQSRGQGHISSSYIQSRGQPVLGNIIWIIMTKWWVIWRKPTPVHTGKGESIFQEQIQLCRSRDSRSLVLFTRSFLTSSQKSHSFLHGLCSNNLPSVKQQTRNSRDLAQSLLSRKVQSHLVTFPFTEDELVWIIHPFLRFLAFF